MATAVAAAETFTAPGTAAGTTGAPARQAGTNLAERYGIREQNLVYRREFVRLGDEDRKILLELIPWSDQVADELAREFYDWQFEFPPTRTFFERFAQERGLPLSALRRALEGTQAGYFRMIFTAARENWGVEYFEHRLRVGWTHDRINLPFKWYIGSYAEYQRLARKYLNASFEDPEFVGRAEEAIFKVFNLDMQAVGDSFLMTTLESMGLNIDDIQTDARTDKTEHLDQVKEAVETLLRQAQAIAENRLGDAILQVEVSGKLGTAFSLMVKNLKRFAEQVAENARALASASEELTAVSQNMSSNAEETASQASNVSSAAEEVSRNAQAVATATEEMTASIKEIAANVGEASRVATGAVKVAEGANATVSQLGESSGDIGKVIKVITSIAEQTNLLALNATIEAARAGDAGKGFAVVANEVKELAKETAKATEDIGQKIEAIQNDAKGAVKAIEEITKIIGQISDIQTTIASAVEEQTATTNDISRNVNEAARGTKEIAENITGVAEAAEHTTAGAADTQRAAAELARMAAELEEIVARLVSS